LIRLNKNIEIRKSLLDLVDLSFVGGSPVLYRVRAPAMTEQQALFYGG
jgi:hypothetical protein